MNIVNLSTGDYVYVSVASRSKVAGKLVEVLSVSDPVLVVMKLKFVTLMVILATSQASSLSQKNVRSNGNCAGLF